MAATEKWLKNLGNIALTGESGDCPYCNGKTDYTYVEDIGKIGYGVVWCTECKRAYIMSRLLVEDGHPIKNPIPEDLKYF